MRALRLLEWDSAPELVSVPVPDAGPGQAVRGLVRPVTTTYPLDDAAFAYQDVAAGRLAGRAVVVPATTPGDHG